MQSNTQGHIFPSSSSHIQENHLGLFEFIGRMLGKAVYEVILEACSYVRTCSLLHEHIVGITTILLSASAAKITVMSASGCTMSVLHNCATMCERI